MFEAEKALREAHDHLTGLQFSYEEKQDCHTTLVNYFKTMHDITIGNDYARYLGWDENNNFFAENYEKEGFYLITDDRKSDFYKNREVGDVLLMSLRGNHYGNSRGTANHCAIWVGNRFMLHHMYGQLSSIVPFKYYNSTTHVLRHRDIVIPKKNLEKVGYLASVPQHKRDMLNAARGAFTEV